MTHLIAQAGRAVAAAALLVGLAISGNAAAAPVSAGQMAAVQAHCTKFASTNKKITATPKAFCGCFLGMVQGKAFEPVEQTVMLSAMAGAPATDGGEWNWPRSEAMKKAFKAQHMTRKETRATYKRMMKKLTPVMPRCAAAKDDAGAAKAASAADATPHAAADTRACSSKSCFSEQFAACKPAVYATGGAMGGKARYEVTGTDGARCRVQMQYTANPNPDWVDKPLSMALDPAKPFDSQIKAALQICLAQDKPGKFDCKGPLRGIAAR